MIEVQRLQNSYCQLLNPLSDLSEDMLIKDTKVSHLSCWMLIVNNNELSSKLKKYTTDDALPIIIRVKYQEHEQILNEYSNLPVANLIEALSKIFNLALNTISVKLIEETKITRIDT